MIELRQDVLRDEELSMERDLNAVRELHACLFTSDGRISEILGHTLLLKNPFILETLQPKCKLHLPKEMSNISQIIHRMRLGVLQS
jgi:hypothetical protein